ncbi:MAG TPA: 2-octaprenyl-6-methoxyphenyl hydroxylase [Steroidobacteraceae bacterium]|nr:2-octaprenyl-6-methoxyphenyl hydroxylase [Steroidobacteraceae bacterium]
METATAPDDRSAFDIAIVGGGLAGASLAAALRELPFSIALVEAFAPDSAAQPSFDERTTALGNASRRIFEALGVWPRLAAEAAPIAAIHVSDAGRYGFARLDAASLGQQALGYVVPNRVLGRELWGMLRTAPRIAAFMPARVTALQVQEDAALIALEQGGQSRSLRARLVVAADGAQSMVRTVAGLAASVDDYAQVAVVAALRTDQPNDGVAYERFTSAGPMALLPLAALPHVGRTGACWRTLVWAASPEQAAALMQLPDAQFLARWQEAFGWRAGRALQLGSRGRYPLALTQSQGTVAPRIVLLGNAAQSLHPVAGQGFNLALRDVAELAEVLACAGEGDPGAAALLAEYAARRQQDRSGVIGFTDALVRVFGNAHPAVVAARDAGLLLFDLLPPAKRALARVSLGFGARSARLARGLPLREMQ